MTLTRVREQYYQATRDDLLEATHIHRVLQKLLEFPEPIYLHHSLVLGPAGKRDQARAIQQLREEGHTATEILAMCRAD